MGHVNGSTANFYRTNYSLRDSWTNPNQLFEFISNCFAQLIAGNPSLRIHQAYAIVLLMQQEPDEDCYLVSFTPIVAFCMRKSLNFWIFKLQIWEFKEEVKSMQTLCLFYKPESTGTSLPQTLPPTFTSAPAFDRHEPNFHCKFSFFSHSRWFSTHFHAFTHLLLKQWIQQTSTIDGYVCCFWTHVDLWIS